MALTKANIKARLGEIAADPATPSDVATYLERLMDNHLKLGRDASVVDAKVDAYLDTTRANLKKRRLSNAMAWIIDRWDELPEG